MAQVRESIEVNVPVQVACNQWTQFESFPNFMEGVKSVAQLDDRRLHWVAEIAGKREEWDAEITHQEPDRRRAWSSAMGSRNAGAVKFRAIGESRTEVELEMMTQSDSAIEKMGERLGVAERTVKNDLRKFKTFIESRGADPTGAWRGEINAASDPR